MTVVAIAAILFSLTVVVLAFAFVKWALRTLERKDRLIENLRKESLERYARLVGQQLEATPREREAEQENRRWRAVREYEHARLIGDPENAVEIPSPSEARFREKIIAADYDFGLDEHGGDDAAFPLFVGPRDGGDAL